MRLKKIYCLPILLFLLMISFFLPKDLVKAEEVKAVSVGTIDYDSLTIQVNANGNPVVYYSTDQSIWYEVEGMYNNSKDSYTMDISWISDKTEIVLYFKGNVVKTIRDVTLPMKNNSLKVTYDKVEGEFSFSEVEETEIFQWRKASDYSWTTVDMNEDSASYRRFMDTMEALRMKGAKIIFRIPPVMGKDHMNTGFRPSKEVTVTLSKRANAPKVTVNSSKLSLNTTSAMEYYDPIRNLWIECTKNMTLEDIAPKVLYKNGSKAAKIMFRTAATSSSPYSNTTMLHIKGQGAAPTIGDNTDDLSYYYMNSKLMLQFPKASNEEKYEYTIIKPGYYFDATAARWTTVSSTKQITLTAATAPEGSKVYIRKNGIDANASKNIELVLASEASFFTVKYPVKP